MPDSHGQETAKRKAESHSEKTAKRKARFAQLKFDLTKSQVYAAEILRNVRLCKPGFS